MSLLVASAVLAIATQGAPPADVAFEELAANRNQAAISALEADRSIDRDDPARMINLGIAYAREGREADARRLFRAAAQDDTPVRLEVAGGDWIDSRELARRALRMLERGEFAPTRRMTMR